MAPTTRQFDEGDEDAVSTSSIQILEIVIDGTTMTFYVRQGENLFSNQNLNSNLEKTERNAYIDTTHEYRFTSKSSNVYAQKEGRGVRISKDSGESTPFIWATKSDPNSHGADSYARFAPAVYQPDLSNDPRTVALEAYRSATEVRGRQANPSDNGIDLMEEGDALFNKGDYAGAMEKYNEGKAKFVESEDEGEEEGSSVGMISGVVVGGVVVLGALGTGYYFWKRDQKTLTPPI